MNYIDQLIENCLLAKDAKPIKELDGKNLESLSCINTAIYIIEEVGGNPEVTFKNFDEFKKKKERACAKLNSPSSCLYVGSSSTGVKKRLEQHLGHGNRSTYALHLCHWFKGEYKITVLQYDVPLKVLQILEDNLSEKLKPAFGKLGSNNR